MLSNLRMRAAGLLTMFALAVPAVAQIDGGALAPADDDVVPRFFHEAGRLADGRVMVSGGLGLQTSPPSLFSRATLAFYDPLADEFTTAFAPLGGGPEVTPVLLTPRSSHTQTTLADGRVLITGGYINASGTSPGAPTASVEVFEPQTGQVTAGPALNVARADHTATRLRDGRVVVAGGATWQIYDPDLDVWSAGLVLNATRTAHAAVHLPSFMPGEPRVLLIGGSGSGPQTMELLDPDTATAVQLTSMLPVGVDDLAAVRLRDGRVLIVGGQNLSTGATLATTHLLDAAVDTLVPLGDVPDRPGGIADHQIVRFGRYVAVFGGEQEVGGEDTELDYVALFDSETLAWHASGTLLYPHDDAAAVRLEDDSVLLVSGGAPYFGFELPTFSCERLACTLPEPYLPGDLNCDGVANIYDINPFTLALASPAGYRFAYPDCVIDAADINGDGQANIYDINPFVVVLSGGS